MSKIEYIAPEVALFHFTAEQGYALSDQTGVNIGIGGWDAGQDYGGEAD